MKEKNLPLLGSIFKPLIIKVTNVKLSHYFVTTHFTHHYPLKHCVFCDSRGDLIHSTHHTCMII